MFNMRHWHIQRFIYNRLKTNKRRRLRLIVACVTFDPRIILINYIIQVFITLFDIDNKIIKENAVFPA